MKVKIGKFMKNGNRRINIQIDQFDTWSLDHTLAQVILPCLVQLRDSKQGVPHEFADVGGEDYSEQSCFDFYKESHIEAFELGCKRWDEMLDKMIWAFQQLVSDDYDNRYHHGKPEYDYVQTDDQYPNPVTGVLEPTYKMVDKNPGEHWYDHVGHREHEKRIEEGLILFGKYFRHLWD